MEIPDLLHPLILLAGQLRRHVSGDSRSYCWKSKAAQESWSVGMGTTLSIGPQQEPPLEAPAEPLLRVEQLFCPKWGRGGLGNVKLSVTKP